MIEINLGRGHFAIIDRIDLMLVSRHSWRAQKTKNSCFAVSTWHPDKPLLMHRLIMGAPNNLYVDHINGNSLDNRRSNLRLATRSENRQNSGKFICKDSIFKGVCLNKKTSRWRAVIGTWPHARKHLGYFDDPKDAALAYDAAAIKLFGKFARLNFPNRLRDAGERA